MDELCNNEGLNIHESTENSEVNRAFPSTMYFSVYYINYSVLTAFY